MLLLFSLLCMVWLLPVVGFGADWPALWDLVVAIATIVVVAVYNCLSPMPNCLMMKTVERMTIIHVNHLF